MTEIYIHVGCAHYGLYANAPVGIPGSHHASVPLPNSNRRREGQSGPDGLWLEPGPLWESGHLVLPAMRAGDLLFFMGSGMVGCVYNELIRDFKTCTTDI